MANRHVKHRPAQLTREEITGRIRANRIVDKLQQFIEGEISMEPHQVTAALGLLSKILPSVKAVEVSSQIERTYVLRAPEVAPSTDQWLKQYGPKVVEHEDCSPKSKPSGALIPARKLHS